MASTSIGTYKLKVWGAQGGNGTYAGGYGGYSKVNKKLTAGKTLYIVVGGQGGSHRTGGYIGGLTSSSTQNGIKAGNGQAKITFVSTN